MEIRFPGVLLKRADEVKSEWETMTDFIIRCVKEIVYKLERDNNVIPEKARY